MKIAVIHEAPAPPPTSRELLMELVKRGVSAKYLRISKLTASLTLREGFSVRYGKVMEELDGALIRGLGIALLPETFFRRLDLIQHIEASGTPTVNSSEGLLKARDKFSAYQALVKAGLPVPETVLTEDLFIVPQKVREWGRAVMKPLMGSMGFGSSLLTDPDIAFNVARTWLTYGQPILLQKFVRGPDRDIRIFVVGEEVLGGMYRYAPEGEWKTNVAQGGIAKEADLTPELEEIALRATEVLKLRYAGVDVGEAEGSYVIYEVNAMPNWQGFKAATGVSPAGRIADLIISLARK